MRYFYDRETDAVSFTLSEVFDWSGFEELSGGAITLHLDRRSRPFAVEIRGASTIVNTIGLQVMHDAPISHDEISRRMSWSDAGRQAWSTIVRRMLVPHYAPAHPAYVSFRAAERSRNPVPRSDQRTEALDPSLRSG